MEVFKSGEQYFIRTVTYHLVGRVEKQIKNFIFLENASWVADSGRFGVAILKGYLNEVEYVGKALVNLNTITDAFPWKHDLPKDSK